ncbi:MAG TPA: helix-turn-helix transcriptional regulator [Candidatus Coproplasma avicola]|uniref:Helix-turn-helix transcriptional regulator n=1 Tax=Candidatus Coproplasma avicola TaxID=2840744 RepID=A0A9D1J8G9_9FIRM|nr:helix-turn-helix transcriptional regulator [Candidatus Coproplasma avicola]
MNRFAERLRELRLDSGMSRKQLAEACRTFERNISYWELGQRECNFDMLIKLANALNTTTDYLLGRTDY